MMSDWFEVSAGVRQGCIQVAPGLFLESINWIVGLSVHRGLVSITLGQKINHLDFADDVALLAEMLKVLILGLEVMNDKSSQLGLKINCSKTKIKASGSIQSSSVSVFGHQVEELTHNRLCPWTKTVRVTPTPVEESSSTVPA